ncbi:dopamine receptor-like protein [Dinothrombium tinctorium]|uniref:Dopamine receptor-like protein n=1 Tax=Dinothrombium tinctorium TaxID=1965070 RepID=A0A3S3P263_9ACAR|nr:dopamine receptor-like protein [Dinothrombium tinctorium]RWS10406.1 dopamine receptor-like protein [Dinothrombium tinctorium]RWS10424.1 dopamine receptor-like protein [Dinothrombium tinctorium]
MRGSFVNVTLAFWSSENKIAIGSQNSEIDVSYGSKAEKEGIEASSGSFWSQSSNEFPERSKSNVFFHPLVKDLFKSNSNGDEQDFILENDTLLDRNDAVANISQLAEKFVHNVTYLFNDTAGCSSYNVSTGECMWKSNDTAFPTKYDSPVKPEKVYWALFLVFLPFLAIFGNILVILSVCRERSLQNVTNYFIVNLAFADLLVAIVVMPFALYYLVSRRFLCLICRKAFANCAAKRAAVSIS